MAKLAMCEAQRRFYESRRPVMYHGGWPYRGGMAASTVAALQEARMKGDEDARLAAGGESGDEAASCGGRGAAGVRGNGRWVEGAEGSVDQVGAGAGSSAGVEAVPAGGRRRVRTWAECRYVAGATCRLVVAWPALRAMAWWIWRPGRLGRSTFWAMRWILRLTRWVDPAGRWV